MAQLPSDTGREVAFAGRSNVGKSSSINKITNRRSLAKTSKTPGRTREINYFAYSENIHIVDLPGYGYAKVDARLQRSWSKLLEYYLQKRKALVGIFLIMDIRRPMTEYDQQMLEYCQTCNLPVHILLNKSDKLSRHAALKSMTQIKNQLSLPNTSFQLFSALKSTGVDIARTKLAEWLFYQ
ncbi:MAG: ribosome biogenesis GTP-binding protein YihA/YsxC [Proteobacteria bacterium]|nr:ribosome biogenesis GTP-binding protein YihA/YsxC [Pseudomonadota bacterium]